MSGTTDTQTAQVNPLAAGTPAPTKVPSSTAGFLGNIFGNEFTGPRWGAIIGTTLTTLAGITFTTGLGEGIIPCIVGGLIGAGAGTLLGGVFNSLVDKLLGAFGIHQSSFAAIPRGDIPQAQPDSVLRIPEQIKSAPGIKPTSTYLIEPNQQNFQGIMEKMQLDVTKLTNRRTRLEGMPISNTDFTGAQAALRQDEANADQLVQNGRMWQDEAKKWNQNELPVLTSKITSVKKSLGFSAPNANEVVKAPYQDFAIPGMKTSSDPAVKEFYQYGRDRFAETGGKVADYDNQDPLMQMRYTQIALDKQYNALRPGNGGGIDIATLRPTIFGGRVSLSFLTDNSLVRWGAEKMGGEMITNDCDEMGQLLNQLPPSSGALARISQLNAHFRGWLTSRTPGDHDAFAECDKVDHYVQVCTLKESANAVQSSVYSQLDQFQKVIKEQFQPHVARMQALDGEIKQLNASLQSMEDNQVKILERGQANGMSYITIHDDKTNSDRTYVAQNASGQYQITQSWEGKFDAAKLTSGESRLTPPITSEDIFSDAGVMATKNLGGVIRNTINEVAMKSTPAAKAELPKQMTSHDISEMQTPANTPAAMPKLVVHNGKR